MENKLIYKFSRETFLKKDNDGSMFVFSADNNSRLLKIKGLAVEVCLLLEKGASLSELKRNFDDGSAATDNNLFVLIEILKYEGYLKEG